MTIIWMCLLLDTSFQTCAQVNARKTEKIKESYKSDGARVPLQSQNLNISKKSHTPRWYT